MSFIISRMKEASTYAGIAALLAGLSFVPHAAEWAALIPSMGTVIAGALAILIPEAKS